MNACLSFLRLPLILLIVLIAIISCHASSPPYDSSTDPPTQRPYKSKGKTYYPIPDSAGFRETGIASWYGKDFHGKRTSNGEYYDMYGATAAHKLLPMNTMIHVKNLDNGKETVVRINDRGPFVKGRILDLSYAQAKKIGIVAKGTARVRITALAPSNRKSTTKDNVRQGEYYVQIGSFRNKKRAMALQKRFTSAGVQTVIQQYIHQKKPYFRVQVFAGKRLEIARKAERSLLNRGYNDAFLIAR